jgi:SAM-dependent methyltransferase
MSFPSHVRVFAPTAVGAPARGTAGSGNRNSDRVLSRVPRTGVSGRSERSACLQATEGEGVDVPVARDDDDDDDDDRTTTPGRVGRRLLLGGTAGALGAGLIRLEPSGPTGVWGSCRCGGCAYAMAPLMRVDQALLDEYDVERNAQQDALFAKGMNSGMTGYEMAVAERKKDLFARLFARLPTDGEATVVEVGMGTFPNAPFYFEPAVYDCKLPFEMLGSDTLCEKRTDGPRADGPRRLDLVGVDPNDAMESFARANLDKASKDAPQIDASLRVVHGVAEALPLPANCADAVVCTLTLCSVLDPAAAVAEMRRILKPGAPLLFIEHVLSEDDPGLAAQQLRFNALQMAMADGCHLDRKTLDVVRAAGFSNLEAVERFTLPGFGLISSQVSGIAIK